jgi:ABC-type Fe3+-hydroxamate transport system substrate-binding protein
MWELVDPEGVVAVKPVKLAPRLNSLKGKTVGLRANGKHNSDHFLNRVAELIQKEVQDVRVVKLWEVLPGSHTYPLKTVEVEQIAKLKPDLIIGAQGD